MCGIAGIVSSTNIVPKLLRSLINLEYRGYDSCGIAVLNDGQIHIKKDKGAVLEVDKKHQFLEMSGLAGIAHTRWATTGIPNKINAHPHLSCNNDFALVHNGIISNYRQLKDKLLAQGHLMNSDTDTEVVVHLLEQSYTDTGDVELALRTTLEQLEGTYAIAFITIHNPQNVYCARKESPLIIGLGDGENYIGSDHNALLSYTRRVITVLDGEYVIVNKNAVIVKRSSTGEFVEHEITKLDWDPELSKKGGYPHFMLKEIHEQPSTIEAVLKIPIDQMEALSKTIIEAKRTYMIGVGTTYYVALIAQYYFKQLSGKFISVISSDEFPYVAEVDPETLVIAFSQSGETYDTLQALRFAKKHGARRAAIVNVLGSSMVREVDLAIMQNSGPEICVLSTKAAFAQIAIAIRCALQLGFVTHFLQTDQHKKYAEQLIKLPSEVLKVINESKGLVNTIAKKYAHLKNWLFLGKGIYSGIALEAALKMKEVSYSHAEGLPGGFMKHGTIALIDDSIGSLFFIPSETGDKELYHHTIANAEEIVARSGLIIGFGFGERSPIFNDQITLPHPTDISGPLLLLVLGQLFAYYTAVALNRNVDRPRSLAKSVTVA